KYLSKNSRHAAALSRRSWRSRSAQTGGERGVSMAIAGGCPVSAPSAARLLCSRRDNRTTITSRHRIVTPPGAFDSVALQHQRHLDVLEQIRVGWGEETFLYALVDRVGERGIPARQPATDQRFAEGAEESRVGRRVDLGRAGLAEVLDEG